MPTRVESILHNARITLADPDGERWSDDTLIVLLNEGLQDFVEETQMLHKRSLVRVAQNNPFIPLPEDCWELTRVLYAGAPLPFVTHKELDDRSCSTWETATGSEPEAVVYDRSNPIETRIYPILADIDTIDTYGVVSDNVINVFGVVANVVNLDLEGDFGVVTDVTVGVYCFYLKTQDDLTSVNSTIETPPQYDRALKFYVCGQAFLSDNDAASQQKGAIQMQQYNTKTQKAKNSSSKDFTRAGQFHTEYRGFQ